MTEDPKLNITNVLEKGREIYERKKEELEIKENLGKYIVIETDSEQIFIGETRDEAFKKAREKFKKELFYVRRIGELEKISSRYTDIIHPVSYNL